MTIVVSSPSTTTVTGAACSGSGGSGGTADTATYTFNLTRDELITEALINCGAFDPESAATPTATQLSQGAKRLNALIKAWSADGLQIWARHWVTVFLQASQRLYKVGAGTTDHMSTVYVYSHLTADAASAATTITVDDTTGISIGYQIGIELNDGTVQWTTVNGAPTATTIPLSAALTSASSLGNMIFAYAANNVPKAIRLNDGYMLSCAGKKTPIRVIAMEEYARFGIDTSEGFTTQVFYKPEVSYGDLRLYPVPNDPTNVLVCEFQYPLAVLASGTDVPGLPEEWYMALLWNLSKDLAASYGVTETRWGMIREQAEAWHQWALGTSQENSVYLQPDPATSWSWWNNGV